MPFLWNVARSVRYGELAVADDPWGYGNSLEWATSSPPPRHNFASLPRIRSERPAFEMHYPHLVDRLQAEAKSGGGPPEARVVMLPDTGVPTPDPPARASDDLIGSLN